MSADTINTAQPEQAKTQLGKAVAESGAESSVKRVNLLGMPRAELKAFFASLNEKPFRADQVMKWLYQRGVTDFLQMTDLSMGLRTRLSAVAEVALPKVTYHHVSNDGTQKWLLDVGAANSGQQTGSVIETVFIPESGRGTLCVSSQVGCALDCDFCSTGKQGFQRDLTAAEIVAQVFIAHQALFKAGEVERPITNVVMMGMGEPLLNFQHLIPALQVMLSDFGYGISKRRLTVSTSGIVPKMDQLMDHVDVSLAVSLHAPSDSLRNKLVPINKKYPLNELKAACQRYSEFQARRRRITFEYVMLQEVNDRLEDADRLIDWLGDLPCKVNLIPFNPFPYAGYKRSSNTRIAKFQAKLLEAGVVTTVRRTRGDDIDAACGQLVGQVKDRTRRQRDWRAATMIFRENEGEIACG